MAKTHRVLLYRTKIIKKYFIYYIKSLLNQTPSESVTARWLLKTHIYVVVVVHVVNVSALIDWSHISPTFGQWNIISYSSIHLITIFFLRSIYIVTHNLNWTMNPECPLILLSMCAARSVCVCVCVIVRVKAVYSQFRLPSSNSYLLLNDRHLFSL